MKLLLQLMMASQKGEPPPDVVAKLEDDPSIRILTHRLNAGQCQVHIFTRLLVAALSEGNPGRLVMWGWTLSHLSMQGTPDDMMRWASAFPEGVPTDEAYNTVWDAQKVHDDSPGSDNWLDRAVTWMKFHVAAPPTSQSTETSPPTEPA